MPLRSLSHRHAIIDAELVACDDSGQPCFRTLMRERGKAATLCLWAFDLMANDNKLLIGLTLKRRRSALAQLIAEVDSEHVQFSIDFDDGDALLAAAERMGLEGVVSKRRKSPYGAHQTGDWLTERAEGEASPRTASNAFAVSGGNSIDAACRPCRRAPAAARRCPSSDEK